MNVQAGTELVSLSHISSQLIEWTDSRLIAEGETNDKTQESICLHYQIAIEGLELAVDESSIFQKTVCQLLGKLFFSAACNVNDISNLRFRASELLAQKKLDLVCKRALEK